MSKTVYYLCNYPFPIQVTWVTSGFWVLGTGNTLSGSRTSLVGCFKGHCGEGRGVWEDEEKRERRRESAIQSNRTMQKQNKTKRTRSLKISTQSTQPSSSSSKQQQTVDHSFSAPRRWLLGGDSWGERVKFLTKKWVSCACAGGCGMVEFATVIYDLHMLSSAAFVPEHPPLFRWPVRSQNRAAKI